MTAAFPASPDDPTGWFEPLYSAAATGDATVPWDRAEPNVRLVAWASSTALRGDGRSAIVVGCGYGRDTEYLAFLGFVVTAFDIAPSAVAGARERYASSAVSYQVADLLDLPSAWVGAFAFVLESITVQALPDPPRPAAIAAVRSLLAPGGTLAVFSGARTDDAPEPDGPPWPLLRREVESFAAGEVDLVDLQFEVDVDEIPRWRAVLERR